MSVAEIKQSPERARPKRSVGRRVAMTLALIVLLTLLAVIGLCVRFASLRPTITREYFNELKTRLDQIPADQRMLPAIERVHAAWRTYIADHPGFEQVFIGETRPGDQNWDAAVAMVDAQAALIDELREASKRPSMGARLEIPSSFQSEYPEGPPLMLAMTTSISAPRSAMRTLQQSVLIRLHRGDFVGAIDDLCAILRIGEKCVSAGTSLEQLVAFAAANNVVEMVRVDLMPRARDVPDAELRRMRAALRGFSFVPGKPLRVLFDFERMSMADVVQRVYSDDGNGDGWFLVTKFEEMFPSLRYGALSAQARKRPVWGAWQFPMAVWADTRAQTVKTLESRLAQSDALLDQPPAFWRRSSRAGAIAADPFLTPVPFQTPSVVADVVLPSFYERMAEIQWVTRQTLSGMDVAFAIEMYRKRTGQIPASLDELVPRDLAEVPIDIFDGKPIKYLRTEAGPRVYTVGVDGVDDKCEESWSESSGWFSATSKDMVLYPHVARPEREGTDGDVNK